MTDVERVDAERVVLPAVERGHDALDPGAEREVYHPVPAQAMLRDIERLCGGIAGRADVPPIRSIEL